MLENPMPTLSQRLEQLKAEGYTEDFNLIEDGLYCNAKACQLAPDDFEIDKFYRFEGATDPADQAIVYAISSEKMEMKGVLVDGYGPSSDPLSHAMIKKLRTF